MKILYLDCTNGISGDMLRKALAELGGCGQQVEAAMEAEDFDACTRACCHEYKPHGHECHGHECHGHDADGHHSSHHTGGHHDHDAGHHHSHHHGRSYSRVKELIRHSGFTPKAKEYALSIYGYIAEAEASVHGESLETIHFHEVGRDEAIRNALGIGMALAVIAPDAIHVSDIYDGKGTIVCSHGEIPVPVPAVRALMEKSAYVFKTADVDTEMVTPSGLAGLLGIGARSGVLTGSIVKTAEIRGRRDTGRGGLKAYIAETAE